MWPHYRLLFVLLLLIDLTTSFSRKVKRKENYLSVPPPPQQHPQVHQGGSPVYSTPTALEHGNQPYQFEDIHPDEFELSPPPLTHNQNHQNNIQNHRNYHTQVQRYETDLIGLHSTSFGGSTSIIDNGLRSIAKGSADQALGAVASQAAAGKQAAYVAKSTLAQAAAQAAGTAIAALKGKEVLLQRLEDQSVEAHKSLEGELAQLQQAKRSAKTAQYSAQQAINHVSVLTAALNNAQTASELAQKAASEAATELASQIDMVAQAKTKLENIEGQLYAARLDYEETKEAVEKATISAQEAQINANDAGAHANVELGDTASSLTHAHNLHEKRDQLVSEASSIQETKREFPKNKRNRRRNHKNE